MANGLKFNGGTSSVVTIPTYTTANDFSLSLTFEFTGNTSFLFSGSGVGGDSWLAFFDTGEVSFRSGGFLGNSIFPSLSVGEFYTINLDRVGNNITLSIGAESSITGVTAGNVFSINEIGRRANSFDGIISAFDVSDGVDVRTYDFDQPSGTILPDTTGSQDGTVFSCTWVALGSEGDITIENFGVGQVFQTNHSTNSKSVTLSGTSGDPASAVEYRIVDSESPTTEITTWAQLVATPTAGSYSQSVEVPEGGYYLAEVRQVNTPLELAIQSASFGIGLIYSALGQSQARNLFDVGVGTPSGQASIYKDGAWSKSTAAGTGQIEFTTAIADATGLPVALVSSGVGNSALLSGIQSDYWRLSSGDLYSNAVQDVDIVGGSVEGVLWLQGEIEAQFGRSGTFYNSELVDFIASQVRVDFGNSSQSVNLPFIIASLGKNSQGGSNSDIQGIRDALFNVATSVTDCYFGASTFDLPLADAVHYTASGYATLGTRLAQSALSALGLVSFYRGPSITSASLFDSTTIDVTIAQDGGTDFTPSTNITGFEVFDDATPVTITSAVHQSATVVRLGLSAAITGAPTARYMYGVQPITTGLVLDDTALNLPLEGLSSFSVAIVSSTLNLTATGLPDGTYEAEYYQATSPLIHIKTENVTFTSETAAAAIPLTIGTAIYTRIDTPTPLITGVTCIGVTE